MKLNLLILISLIGIVLFSGCGDISGNSVELVNANGSTNKIITLNNDSTMTCSCSNNWTFSEKDSGEIESSCDGLTICRKKSTLVKMNHRHNHNP